jgi:photosystem II stability/assembly factor-like uncharacterized protein
MNRRFANALGGSAIIFSFRWITASMQKHLMRACSSWRQLAAATLLLLAIAPSSLAGTAQRAGSPSDVVALVYDAGSDALLKAEARALYRGSSAGRSWAPVPLPPAAHGQIAAVAAPANSKGVLYVAGPELGVWQTVDEGKTWAERIDGLPSRNVVALTAHTTQSETLYAFVPEQGIYRSEDAGKGWRLMDAGPKEGLRQLIHSNMKGSMQTGWLFAATTLGVRRIMDCFCLWQDAGRLRSETYSITFDPRQPEHIFAAAKTGLFRSTNGGQDWTRISSPSSSITALAFTRSGMLYGIDSSEARVWSADQGDAWERVDD